MLKILGIGWLVCLQALRVVKAQTTGRMSTSIISETAALTTEIATSLNCSQEQTLQDLKCIDQDLKKNDSSLAQFLLVAAISVAWVIYLTFFNSRLFGFILTKCLNHFIRDGYFKVGSFSLSVLSGKIMFRDVQYITPDSSIFIYDGYCIFRWWRPYKFSPWRKKKDLNEGHTRLSVFISGLEYHVYNRSAVYGKLEELFGLDSQTFISKSELSKKSRKKSEAKDSQKIDWWRNLIPVIKITVSYGKIIFGNKLLPSTLVVAFEDANAQYKTTKASNIYDLFMHVLEGTLGSVKCMLVASPKYDISLSTTQNQFHGPDPPPRKMGEGYDVIHSNNVVFKYVWDEPGKTGVPLAESKFSEYEVKSNENEEDDNSVWELEVQCEKRVTLNYGPWADRQVNQLWRFYYPLDFQNQEVTQESSQGELRAPPIFNMYISLRQSSNFDLMFLKNDDPGAIHITVDRGTCIELHVPMVVTEDGFTTHIAGQLIYPDASTSMSYRPLLNAETLSFNINAVYPLAWNGEQTWTCDFKASKVSVSLLFDHKSFIADLMDDWSNRDLPDLLTFAPYKMKFSFDLQDFELLLPANEYNWVDCATKRKENALVGLTGKSLNIGFTLPFHSFLATTYHIPFTFHVWRAELCLFLPLSNPSRSVLLNLRDEMEDWKYESSSSKPSMSATHDKLPNGTYHSRDAKYQEFYVESHKLRKETSWGSIHRDWVKCWDAPEMNLLISYKWHPVVPSSDDKRPKDLTDVNKEIEKAEKLMIKSFRSSRKTTFRRTTSVAESADGTESVQIGHENIESSSKNKPSVKFDPTSLDPDEISVEFTLQSGSTLFLYGSLLHHFVAIKENYLGIDDKPTDFSAGQILEEPDLPEEHSNPLYYRTLQVTVNVNLHNVRGVLPVHMNPGYNYCPTVRMKQLTFEMDKNYHQTRLQLLLSKLAIEVEESSSLFTHSHNSSVGWLMLTDLQLRGHAMFSGEGLPLGAVTIEYGWLTEVLVGPISGKLTVPQLQLLAQWAEMFVFLMKNSLHEMNPAYPSRYLPTGMNWNDKKQDGKPIAEGDVKYLMMQVKLDSINVRVGDRDSVLDLSVSPVLISNGNIQFPGVKEAASIRVREVLVKQRVMKPMLLHSGPFLEPNTWIEAGEMRFGSLHIMITVATPEREMCARQSKFLTYHDKKTRRLHFLYRDNISTEAKSTQKSALSTVQTLKSWGCNFFTPVTSKHPTYVYKYGAGSSKKWSNFSGQYNYSTTFQEFSDEANSEKDDESDRDSDVFDPGMEYGMSLLSPGKCLLSRRRTLRNSRKDRDPNKQSLAAAKADNPSNIIVQSVTHENFQMLPSPGKLSRPSLARQTKITGSTGQIFMTTTTAQLSDLSPALKRSSLTKNSEPTTISSMSSFNKHHATQPQVTFAPSPEKISTIKKSSSQADIDAVDGDSSKATMKRARSSDSNLYRSAESDFKSTTSLSSSDFYSAESDIDATKDSTPSEFSGASPTVEGKKSVPAILRPESLPLDVGHMKSVSNEQAVSNNLLTPVMSQTASLSPGSGHTSVDYSAAEMADTPSPTLLKCYQSQLTTLSLVPLLIGEAQEEDEIWFPERFYRLPKFEILTNGIHPSIIVDKNADKHRKSEYDKMATASRELSFEDLDSSGKSTSISVHLRESLDVQLTPFLLKSVTEIVEAATPMMKNDNPVSVISQLEMHCINDAADRVPDDQELVDSETKEKDKKKAGKIEKSRPSLRRQKRMDGSVEEGDKQGKKAGPTVTRPPPGTKLHARIDRVRINILQTTLGDDKIFSVKPSKLQPAPCITVLSSRLEKLIISVDMNSRRKNRLLMENLRKMSRSSSSTSVRRPSEIELLSTQKSSVSTDVTSQMHFLVLLNAKATAKSVAVQMRALTTDCNVPKRTSIAALTDKDCRAPFRFNPLEVSPDVKALIEKWHLDNDNHQSGSFRKTHRHHSSGPPKEWGWVMLEAGVDEIRINVVKQVPVKGLEENSQMPLSSSISSSLLQAGESKGSKEFGNDSAFHSSTHVHFAEEACPSISNSLQGADDCWKVQDSNLHASQGELAIKSVWINVPAPPGGVSSGKALRTWNLLTCLSSGITSWLDPADRLATAISKFNDEKEIRISAVIACALTESFDRLTNGKDVPEKPMEPTLMKYDVLTPKAKILRKDPNFLMSHELQRFVSTLEGRQIITAAVGPFSPLERRIPDLPALPTLKKGISAVLRQWASHYSGIINSAKLKSLKKGSLKNDAPYGIYEFPINTDERAADLTKEKTLVLPVEVPGNDTPTKRLKPVLETNTASVTPPDVEAGCSIEMTDLTSSRRKSMQPMSSRDDMGIERLRSQSDVGNFPKSTVSLDSADIESQPLVLNEQAVEETDLSVFPIKQTSVKEIKEGTMIVANSEDVFQIFLQNVGFDIDSPVPVNASQDTSFIRGECLGSLSVNAKLTKLSIDKQEPDPLYNLDGPVRRKKKSMKNRKSKSYYSSLEHARERREPYVVNTTTWPHVYHPGVQQSVKSSILLCQKIELKSSIVEKDVLQKDRKSLNTTIMSSAHEKFLKKRHTLNVEAQLSVDHITQHVDIALARLIHQIMQISDNIQQAKTNIQVNKYTEGSVSPDFKVLHRRTTSILSEASNTSSVPINRQLTQSEDRMTEEDAPLSNKGDNDEDMSDSDSESSASTVNLHCWQVMYKMVDLYESVPENGMEAVQPKPSADAMHVENENVLYGSETNSASSIRRRTTFNLPHTDPYIALVLRATAGVTKVEMHASVGDLKLNAELTGLMTEVDHVKEVINTYKSTACSKFATNLNRVGVNLIDQGNRHQTTNIATASVERSSLHAQTNHKRESSQNIASFHLGIIKFDLSQHPASLHDVVSRGSRQLSAHISEFATTPTLRHSYQFDQVDSGAPCTPVTPAVSSTATGLPPITPVTPSALTTLIDLSSQDSSSAATSTPVNAQFSIACDGVAIVASLLPSLHASYQTQQLKGEGHMGLDSTFSFSLPSHLLKFTNKNGEDDSTTVINLPEINIEGEYKKGDKDFVKPFLESWKTENIRQYPDETYNDLMVRSGDYISVFVHIGSFEHSLTTDLLNQLIFLQEVFLKEINEMIDKVSKTSKPVSLWSGTSIKAESAPTKPLLYQLKVSLQGIQITAATASLNAVRLKTGEIMFELSNKVAQNKVKIDRPKKRKKGIDVPKYLKLFGKAQVDLTLSLGTLVHNSVYPEAEDDFLQLASFTTRIGLQNTREGKDNSGTPVKSQVPASFSPTTGTSGSKTPQHFSVHRMDGKMLNPDKSEESENSVVLISLNRPHIFIQPTAFDKAILVYLSYKNAYEDWKEQQQAVIVKTAKQVRDVFQSTRNRPYPTSSMTSQRSSSVFLQLSVKDLGICLPVSQTVQLHQASQQDEMMPAALVLTIDSTLISASYCRSLVTKGKMNGFCMRFADDFQSSLDDWRHTPLLAPLEDTPSSQNCIMNALVVPEGTYEISSDTNTYNTHLSGPSVAKTSVTVLWRMKGMDVHFDTKVASYFSRLTDTLMAITGEDEPNYDADLDINMIPSEDDSLQKQEDTVDGMSKKINRTFSNTTNSSSSSHPLPPHLQEERIRQIEHQLNEQAKVIKDLQQLGAKKSTIEEEQQRLHDLEAALSSNFRRTFKSKFRQPSIKGPRKDHKKKFRPTHQRAKSAVDGDTGTEPVPRQSHSAYATLPHQNFDGTWRHFPVLDTHSADAITYQKRDEALMFRADPLQCVNQDRSFGVQDFYSTDSASDTSYAEDDVDGKIAQSAEDEQDGPRYSDTVDQFQSSKSENSVANTSQGTNASPEAEIQLELDIRAVVDGGKIECHPRVQEIDISAKQEYGMMPPTYPSSKVQSVVRNTTIFFIPGLNVHVQYNSASSATTQLISAKVEKKEEEKIFTFSPLPMETVKEVSESTPETGSYVTPPVSSNVMNAPIPEIEVTTPSPFTDKKEINTGLKSKSTSVDMKRACVRAKLNLQSLPEIVISPYLLDFLEQTLQELGNLETPQQSFSQKHSTSSSRQDSFHGSFTYSDDEGSDLDAVDATQKPKPASVISSENQMPSLPLDVIVEVNVQPSQVRFNCVPMSRVECLLKIPNIDLKFSSIEEDITNLPFSSDEDDKKSGCSSDVKSSENSDHNTSLGGYSPRGLIFTAMLSDFSIYVFHPYGGKQSTSAMFPMDATFIGAAGMADSPFNKSGSGRRDSLSVNLEFVKIELARRRSAERISINDSVSSGYSKTKADNCIVRVSGLLDIGKASFKYDMRRLNEILAFPRAWYRRSIARRLFLGDTSEQPSTNSPLTNRKNQKVSSGAKANSSKNNMPPTTADSSIFNFLTADTPLSPNQRQLSVKASSSSGFPKGSDQVDGMDNVSTSAGTLTIWQALVMLKMKMSRLEVEMNIGNVMGNTVWFCDTLSSTGKLMFHSNGDRDITLACGLEKSQIHARGGVIGGNIELNNFSVDCRLLDPSEGEPLHRLGMKAESVDGKIEYMGACVMMGQLTKVDFELKDEWSYPAQSLPSNINKGTVYVHCDLGWRVFQLSISRSSTPDVIKMLTKLEEFFSQQLHSSVRALSSITQSHSRPGTPTNIQRSAPTLSSKEAANQYDHRRHWPPVFKAVSAALADSDLFESGRQLQKKSVLLGGSAYLHGDGLIVVCFHGLNFRSRSWVLFNILQPNIQFSTEVQEIQESDHGDEASTLAIQSLTVTLGHDKWLSRTQKSADPLATVSRVTRSTSQNPPPGSAPIAEWFAYMTASRNEELKMLRTLNNIGSGNYAFPYEGASKPSNNQSGSKGGVSYNHEADIIFALPKVQLDFKTEHIQAPTEPDPNDPTTKPVVECTFVTEFTDHICVTMDVELLMFLHDLISSYLKEKHQALSSRTKLTSLNTGMWDDGMGSSFSSEPSAPKPIPVDPIDLREFVCKNWQLEPTVTLISWAGRRIEPVGVDYILQKLGFQHARTTIPKWFQRGVLDLLDKGLAIAVGKLVVAVLNDQKKKQ